MSQDPDIARTFMGRAEERPVHDEATAIVGVERAGFTAQAD